MSIPGIIMGVDLKLAQPESTPSDEAPLRVTVLSGKGGTGKTFVSVGLAVTAPLGAADSACYVDCDVEEPNGHLFLRPEALRSEPVHVMVPVCATEWCSGCRICTSFCHFHALAYIRDHVKLFPELCHGCNGCVLLCPTGAMTEGERPVGDITFGRSGEVEVLTGNLQPGEASGMPVITALMRESRCKQASRIIMDAPPGSGCAVMECIRESDACILVAEPTPFGLHDVEMVATLVRKLGKPAGLLFNRCAPESEPVVDQAGRRLGLPVLDAFPFMPDVAKSLAEGDIPARESTEWRERFARLWARLRQEVPA